VTTSSRGAEEVSVTQFSAFKGFYTGTLALVLGPDIIVWLVDVIDKVFVIEQHGQIIDEGRLSPLQAKHFTEAATGARVIERRVVDPDSLVHSAGA
jgi:hypothetical protein